MVLSFLVHESLHIGNPSICTFYCKFCGTIIVAIDLIVILCLRMNKNADHYTQVFQSGLWITLPQLSPPQLLPQRSVQDEYLGNLGHVLDCDLWHNKCCRFCQEGLVFTTERRGVCSHRSCVKPLANACPTGPDFSPIIKSI